MNIDNSIISGIDSTIAEIIDTAQNVNKLSHVRKQITSESLLLISELLEKNSEIILNYKKVYESLQKYIDKYYKKHKDFQKQY